MAKSKIEMVNKDEFIRMVSEASDKLLSQREVRAAMEYMSVVITDIIKEQKGVKIGDVVTVYGQLREAHVGRNPSTGEAMNVPAKVVPKAKFSQTVKAAINS